MKNQHNQVVIITFQEMFKKLKVHCKDYNGQLLLSKRFNGN